MVVSRIIKGNIPVQNGIVHLIGKYSNTFQNNDDILIFIELQQDFILLQIICLI